MSLLGHIIIILLMVLDLSFGFKKPEVTPPAVMMVDLSKIKISNKTNLPQKSIVFPKKTPQKTVAKEEGKKSPIQKKVSPKPVQKSEEKPLLKPKEQPVKEAVIVKNDQQIPEKKTELEKKTEKKSNTDLQSLLASVEKVRRVPNKAVQKSETEIQTGAEGRIDQILTISERDYLASELQKCWNIDAGVEHADEILVEIKAWINKDGSVRDVRIMNSMPISSFKTVAESAKRAIYICDHKGGDSPFRILAEKYADYYGEWKEILLHFNPLNGIR